METTRWLWMLASLGFDQVLQAFPFPDTWRNSWTPARGMGLNSQERNLRNSNWSRRRSQSSASPIGKILVYQNHYLTNLIKFSPKVMPSWRHIPYLGEERRTCRSAPGSCVHFWTTCFWGVESNRTVFSKLSRKFSWFMIAFKTEDVKINEHLEKLSDSGSCDSADSMYLLVNSFD